MRRLSRRWIILLWSMVLALNYLSNSADHTLALWHGVTLLVLIGINLLSLDENWQQLQRQPDDLWATADHITTLYPISPDEARALVLMIGTSDGAFVAAKAIGKGLQFPQARAAILASRARTKAEVEAALLKVYPRINVE